MKIIRSIYCKLTVAIFLFIVAIPVFPLEKIIFIEHKDDKTFYHRLFQNIREKKVCLISNQAGSGKYLFMPSTRGFPSYFHEILADHNISLYKIFSPEHGISSQSEDNGFSTDAMLIGQIAILPAYHKTSMELNKMFEGCHGILFDLPDAGIRPYTYRTILTRSIQAVSSMKEKVVFYLIDRENPAAIYTALGPVVREEFFSYLGEQDIPFFPFFTYAELTRFYIRKNRLNLNIRYIAMPHYRPGKNIQRGYIEPPSPSLPHRRALQCYWIGIFFEGTTLDFGKYSKDPFCLIGHPEIDYKNDPPEIAGITWSKYIYKPFSGPYQNILLRGYKMEIVDISQIDPVKAGYEILTYFTKTYPQLQLFKYGTTMYAFDKIVGNSTMRESIVKKIPYRDWNLREEPLREKFLNNIFNYRIY